MSKNSRKKYVSPSSRFNPEYEEVDPEYEIVEAEMDWLIIWKAFDNLAYIICTYYDYKLFGNPFPLDFSKQLKRCLSLNSVIGSNIDEFNKISDIIHTSERELNTAYNGIKKWLQQSQINLSNAPASLREKRKQNSIRIKFEQLYKIYQEICSAQKIGTELDKAYRILDKKHGPILTWNKKPLDEALIKDIQEFILLTSVLVLQLSLLEDSELNQMD